MTAKVKRAERETATAYRPQVQPKSYLDANPRPWYTASLPLPLGCKHQAQLRRGEIAVARRGSVGSGQWDTADGALACMPAAWTMEKRAGGTELGRGDLVENIEKQKISACHAADGLHFSC